MKPTLRLAACALLALSGAVAAKDKPDAVMTAQDTAAFDTQAAGVRAQLSQGGRYEFVRADERAILERRLDEMHGLLAEHGPVSAMNDYQRVQLFNAQEEINAILTRRDAKRLICQRRPPTGSHVAENKCITYGEQERVRDATQRHLNETLRQGQASSEIETRGSIRLGGGE